MNLLSLALKNLRRHRIRTVLTILGIAISALALFSILSFNYGYDKSLKKEISGSGIHLFVARAGCPLQAASLIIHGGETADYLSADLIPQIKGVKGVKEAGGFLIASSMTGNKVDLFYGITDDVAKIKDKWKIKGSWFTGPDSVILGSDLAKKVAKTAKAGIGDRIHVASINRDFTVSGVLKPTGGEDDGFYFMPLATAQDIFDKPNKVTAVGIQLSDVSLLQQVKTEVEQMPQAYVVPAEDMTSRVLDLVKNTKSIMFGILAIVLAVSALGVFNIVLMATFERRSEFGFLRCVGAGKRAIFGLILIESLMLGIGGLAIGVAAGYLSSAAIGGWLRHFLPYAPSGNILDTNLAVLGITAGIILALGLLAGIYPGYRASTVPPMEAIRNE
jgi:putative ABC transport system permease protein